MQEENLIPKVFKKKRRKKRRVMGQHQDAWEKLGSRGVMGISAVVGGGIASSPVGGISSKGLPRTARRILAIGKKASAKLTKPKYDGDGDNKITNPLTGEDNLPFTSVIDIDKASINPSNFAKNNLTETAREQILTLLEPQMARLANGSINSIEIDLEDARLAMQLHEKARSWNRSSAQNINTSYRSGSFKIFAERQNNIQRPTSNKNINLIGSMSVGKMRNATPYVGDSELIEEQRKQTEKFKIWADNEDWKNFHVNHYDWWTFPIDKGSSAYGFMYDISGQPLERLKNKNEYLNSLRDASRYYLKSLGWNMDKLSFVSNPQKLKGQSLDDYLNSQRLFKISRSLQIHGLDREFDSVNTLAKILRESKNLGNNNYWDNPKTFKFTSRFKDTNQSEITGRIGSGNSKINLRGNKSRTVLVPGTEGMRVSQKEYNNLLDDINNLWSDGYSNRDIGIKLNVASSGISALLKRLNKSGKLSKRPSERERVLMYANAGYDASYIRTNLDASSKLSTNEIIKLVAQSGGSSGFQRGQLSGKINSNNPKIKSINASNDTFDKKNPANFINHVNSAPSAYLSLPKPTDDLEIARETGRPVSWLMPGQLHPMLNDYYNGLVSELRGLDVSNGISYATPEEQVTGLQSQTPGLEKQQRATINKFSFIRQRHEMIFTALLQQLGVSDEKDRGIIATGLVQRAASTVAQAVFLSQKYNSPNMTDEILIDLQNQTEEVFNAIDYGLPVRAAVTVPADKLAFILIDGRLKTQHETGTSMGNYNPDTRNVQEFAMFSIHPRTTQRPIYGSVRMGTVKESSDKTSQYGAATIMLKEKALERTTWTQSDSLSHQTSASTLSLDNKTWDGLYNQSLHQRTKDNYFWPAISDERMKEFGRTPETEQWPFIEAQIHGGVYLADIAYIIVDEDWYQDNPENLYFDFGPDVDENNWRESPKWVQISQIAAANNIPILFLREALEESDVADNEILG